MYFFFFYSLYKYLFAPYPKQGDHSCTMPHRHSLNNCIQTQVASCPDSQSSPRQIFFRGAVRFKRWGVGGWLFFQPGEFAQGPSCAAAVQGPMGAARFGSHAPDEPAQPPVGRSDGSGVSGATGPGSSRTRLPSRGSRGPRVSSGAAHAPGIGSAVS